MIDYLYPLLIGDDELQNERLHTQALGRDLYMEGPDSVRFIVVHCSATRADRDYTAEQLQRDHRARGFRTGGYHFYIRKSGEVARFRQLLEVGAHARGYNRCSIGICYEGGLVAEGEMNNEKFKMKNGVRLVPADTRTPEQKQVIRDIVLRLHQLFPHAMVLGHRDLPGVHKSCPCYNVTAELPLVPRSRP